MRLTLIMVALAALASLAPAIGAEGGEVEVRTLAGSFSHETVHVEPGTVVVWRNTDGRGHTVTSAWDDGATFHAVLQPGEEFRVRFDAAGEYRIRCVPHSVEDGHGGHEGMVSTVQVGAPAAAPGESGGFPASLLLVPLAAALLGFVAFKLRGVAVPWPRRAPRPSR